MSTRPSRRDGYETALLSAYGTVDRDVLDVNLRLHALHGAVWRAHVSRLNPGRVPTVARDATVLDRRPARIASSCRH